MARWHSMSKGKWINPFRKYKMKVDGKILYVRGADIPETTSHARASGKKVQLYTK